MDRVVFASLLQRAILSAWEDFSVQHAEERAYAFALIGGKCANYLGYAIATEEGLQRIAKVYDLKGYRYKGAEWEVSFR